MGNKRVKIITRLMALLFVGGAAHALASPESCTRIESADERLACYDSYFMTSVTTEGGAVEGDVASETSVTSNTELSDASLVEASSAEQMEAPVGATSEAVVGSAASDVELSAEVVAEAETKAREAYEQVITDAQTLTISAVQRTRRGSVFFQTEQGRTFKRETSRNVYFSDGDRVTIERGVFSSLFLENQDGLRIKVSEVD
jgi:hypothetical protein